MTAIVLRGDAAHLPLADGSVDLIVTSPPYWGLRSYTDDGEHYDGQIGSERTPGEYIAALLDCTREWMRVLKPEGSLFLNLGDKYSGNETGGRLTAPGPGMNNPGGRQHQNRRQPYRSGMRPKTLLGMPWRYALGCIDDLGLILRAEIVWAKPNGLPESVTDRVRRSHEQVFHLTKQPRYYSAVDEIREGYSPNKPWGAAQKGPGKSSIATAVVRGSDTSQQQSGLSKNKERIENPLGKLPGSVWEIPSAPLIVPVHLGVDHFAAYPPELVRRIILGWSPSGICTECGEGRRPVSDGQRVNGKHGPVNGAAWGSAGKAETATGHRNNFQTIRTLTGYACACPDASAPTRPALVVDPFGGTGTTALVASVLGRTGITVDRSADYCRLAQWRTTDPGERARALGVPKPPPVAEGQGSLFDLFGQAS